MQDNLHGLLINNKIYPLDALLDLCENIKDDKSVPEWEKKAYSFIEEWIDDKDFVWQTSSGTTGNPKKLKLPKKSMVLSARKTCKIFDLRFGNTVLLCLPIDYIAGKMMIVRAFVY